tara:strand:+ start:791 stop:1000 length:210 start_codon:yes stop_codon:yes gene_type:complete
MALSDKERAQSRERSGRYREGKTTVSFTTSPEIKESLKAMADKYGYKSIREFMEALALGHAELDKTDMK